jgi:rubrerythrin
MLLREFIKLAMDIELAAAAVYDLFAQQFSDQVEFSTFWRLSAEAERYHAATVRICGTAILSDREVDEAQLPTEIASARRLLERLSVLIEDLRAHPRNAAEAIDVALDLESEGAEIHGRTQFAFLYPELAEMFSRLADEDREHRKSFALAKAKFAGA